MLRKLKNVFLIFNIFMFFCIACANNFDGNKAYYNLKKQCDFGARVPGSLSHEKCRNFIIDKLKQHCDSVYVQSFTQKVAYSIKPIVFYNIIGIINPNKRPYYMLCSHYDSRPFSNKEGFATPGANDGASSTALLIEMARIVKSRSIDKRVDFIFFDGEDGGTKINPEDWFIGSRYFAKNIKEKPDYAIVIDMIGDKNLNIYREGNSDLFNYDLNKKMFNIAKQLNKKSFIDKIGYYIEDDHIPLIEVGIKCINIIDMDYKFWHTTEDTPDKCSSKSLKDVGDVILRFLYEK